MDFLLPQRQTSTSFMTITTITQPVSQTPHITDRAFTRTPTPYLSQYYPPSSTLPYDPYSPPPATTVTQYISTPPTDVSDKPSDPARTLKIALGVGATAGLLLAVVLLWLNVVVARRRKMRNRGVGRPGWEWKAELPGITLGIVRKRREEGALGREDTLMHELDTPQRPIELEDPQPLMELEDPQSPGHWDVKDKDGWMEPWKSS